MAFVDRILNCKHVKYEHHRLGRLTHHLTIREWKLVRILTDFVGVLTHTFKTFYVIWVFVNHDQGCSFSTDSDCLQFREVSSHLHSGHCQFACHVGFYHFRSWCLLCISGGLFKEIWLLKLSLIRLYTLGLKVSLRGLFSSLRKCFRCVLL